MNRCPVCMRAVSPTGGANIYAHADTAGSPCPGSGQPYRITVCSCGCFCSHCRAGIGQAEFAAC